VNLYGCEQCTGLLFCKFSFRTRETLSTLNEWLKMDTGLVSIIIPSYNGKHWICDAIDSALQQSYLHCEVIVVDDGSNDGTRDLLLSKYGNLIRYIYQNNKGLSGARNTGLFHSRGSIFNFSMQMM